MGLSAETQRWLDALKKEGGLTEEAYKAIEGSLGNDKADNFVKGSVLRQDDYSRQMNAAKEASTAVEKAAAELKTREASVTKFQTDLANWKTGAEGNYQKALAEAEKAQVKLSGVVAKFRTTAMVAGLDPDEMLKELEVAPVEQKQNQQNQPQFDASKYVAREDLGKAVAESGVIDASIHDLSIEHMELTGQPLRNARQLVEEAIAARKPLTQYAAEKYGYDKLRKDKQEADIQKRIDEGVAAGVQKRLSEEMLPGSQAMRPGSGMRDDLKGSPVFSNKLKAPTDEGGGGVSAAIAAFQAGTYKGGVLNK